MNARPRVVIVEDDADVRDLLTLVVASMGGAQVVGTASDVAGGSLLLQRLQPDAALIDVGLPDGSGLELLQVSPATRKVVLSAAVIDDQTLLTESGARAFLQKPCLPQEIVSALRHAVDS
jgi:DNA-binding NarL/FixJ family response regulator